MGQEWKCSRCGLEWYGYRTHTCQPMTKTYEDGLREAAEIVRGEWHPWSNTLSAEYILRHRLAQIIEAKARERTAQK